MIYHSDVGKDIVSMYKVVFGTNEGKAVLDHLRSMFVKPVYKQFVDNKYNKLDPLDVAWRAGRAATVEKIEEILNTEN